MLKHSIHGSRSFIRGIRTRRTTSAKIKLTNNHNNTLKPTSLEDTHININHSKSITKKSKFTNPSDQSGINEILKKLNYKNPKDIEFELIEKFKHDGMEVDTEFIQNMINESVKEQEILKNYLNDPSNTINNINIQELNNYIDWIINDSIEKLKTQKIDKFKEKVKLRNELNDFLINSNHEQTMDPEPLTNAFSVFQDLNKLNSNLSSSLDHLPILLKELNKFKNFEILNSISLDKISSLYEISTQLLNLENREKCIYLCGKLLYKSLVKEYGPRARPDIINEKFYIESCLKFNDLNTAFQLYNSRLEKDSNVQNQRFWYELGISINISKYSESNDLKYLDNAIDLINQIRSKWAYVNNLILIDCLKRCSLRGNFDDALWFWDEIKINLSEFGIIEKIEIPETKLYNDNEIDKVFNYYNRIEPMFYDGLIQCVFSFLSGKKFDNSMEILNYLNELDNHFIHYFVEIFGNDFRYSGRELFLIYLENEKQQTPLSNYLIDQIKPLQNIRCSSIDEANLIEEINIYLERLTNLKSKNLSKIKDLHEIIQSGEKLNSFDIRSIIKVLLQHKSITSYTLACKIIYQLNDHKLKNINNSILPISTSHIYTEFFQQFLSQSNPRTKDINKFLNLMIDYDIKLDQNLANKIIISYTNKKLFSEAIKFIESFIFTDNPISIKEIKISKSDSHNLYTAIFLAYYKSVSTGTLERDNFELRLNSLRYYIKKMMDNKIDNIFTIKEAIGALLSYGDYDGLICLIQWYGLNIGDINFDLVLAIKSKLELTILKAEKYLKLKNSASHHEYNSKIENYRLNFGIQSLQNDLKTKRNFTWQEVALVIYNYADLFGYKSNFSKDDPFSRLISDSERLKNKEVFDLKLEESQKYFNLPNWMP